MHGHWDGHVGSNKFCGEFEAIRINHSQSEI